jgi:hypothetical protein
MFPFRKKKLSSTLHEETALEITEVLMSKGMRPEKAVRAARDFVNRHKNDIGEVL